MELLSLCQPPVLLFFPNLVPNLSVLKHEGVIYAVSPLWPSLHPNSTKTTKGNDLPQAPHLPQG